MNPKEDKLKTKSLPKLRCIVMKLLKINKEKKLWEQPEKNNII